MKDKEIIKKYFAERKKKSIQNTMKEEKDHICIMPDKAKAMGKK